MSVEGWIRPHSEVEMDTRLGGLSQPPSLQQLVLLSAWSTEWEMQGRQGWLCWGCWHHTSTTDTALGSAPSTLNACGWIFSLVELRGGGGKVAKRAVNKPEGRQWTAGITFPIWLERDFSERKATSIKPPHSKGNSKEMSPSPSLWYPERVTWNNWAGKRHASQEFSKNFTEL